MCLYRKMIIYIPATHPSVYRNCLFCWYSLNLDQSVSRFGILPVCHMFYVKSVGLLLLPVLHCLCIFLMLLKKRTFLYNFKEIFFICLL